MANTSVVGLDLGSSAIRGVQVSKDNKGNITIEKAGVVPLPLGAIVSGLIEEEAQVVEALKKLWKEAKFTTSNVHLGVGSDSVVARVGRVDWARDRDLKLLLPHTDLVKTAVVEEIQNYYIDYHTLGEDVHRVPNPHDPDETILKRTKLIFVGGATKEPVDKAVTAARKAGLKPTQIDLEGLALIRAHNPEYVPDTMDAVDVSVDIGAQTTTLVIHKKGQPMYMRTNSGRAGQAITQKIATALKVPYDRAELRKFEALYSSDEVNDDGNQIHENSVFDMQEEIQAADPNTLSEEEYDEERKRKDRKAKIDPIISQGSSDVINFIRGTVQHFLDGEAGSELNRIGSFALSGGMSLMPGLSQRIMSEFQVPTYASNPLSGNMSEKAAGKMPETVMNSESSFNVAYGLAIGEGSTHD